MKFCVTESAYDHKARQFQPRHCALQRSPQRHGNRPQGLPQQATGKTLWACWNFTRLHVCDNKNPPCRMLKKAVQQGRSKRRGDAYSLPYVEPLNVARTKLADFFSILLSSHTRMAGSATKPGGWPCSKTEIAPPTPMTKRLPRTCIAASPPISLCCKPWI